MSSQSDLLNPPPLTARAWLAASQFVRQQPFGTLGALIIVAIGLSGLFAEWVAPYDPLEIDYFATFAPPSWEHWAGTDEFGRDILSRLIYGARTAMIISLSASTLGVVAGAILGMASAYFGGRIDFAIQRVMDILLSFPIIVLALVVVAVLGRFPVAGVDLNLVVAIAIPMIPKSARVIRAAALQVAVMPYVDAARALGFSHSRIILRHMAPNLVAPFLILFTAYVAQAILLEAALSFLGLGVTEPTPAWGLMLSGNATQFFMTAPWAIIFPGLAISLSVFAFNLYGDALRDWLDPKFKF
ncbi:MAG: ABC transporter permease [Rhodobacter sp.]|uniref:ABC transporter permease n=1 Tax=Pararhodobacter sp. TaxID=2127056 RepID=UPI001D43D21C|nr:ABC transporter permease [Pararhodobacter sp.]MCB1344024.1 ABC transporter permease [Paracoccaceae bacterium]MCC0074919.1 ABC transporter permease [Rhodobacter sp.]HPD91377.1 ABC transporter permease [Pararhodobacter sp.]